MKDQSQQIKIDTLRGELREEKEVVEALEESKRDAERILSKKIDELLERTAERDQLRQQVERLLGAADDVLKLRRGIGPKEAGGLYLPDNFEARTRLHALDQAADQVRKELEG
jgi:predicted flap endonuclease-1-like 5' DNA nuclease